MYVYNSNILHDCSYKYSILVCFYVYINIALMMMICDTS